MSQVVAEKENGEIIKVWDAERKVGAEGQTHIKVHYSPKNGTIHGYPVFRTPK